MLSIDPLLCEHVHKSSKDCSEKISNFCIQLPWITSSFVTLAVFFQCHQYGDHPCSNSCLHADLPFGTPAGFDDPVSEHKWRQKVREVKSPAGRFLSNQNCRLNPISCLSSLGRAAPRPTTNGVISGESAR